MQKRQQGKTSSELFWFLNKFTWKHISVKTFQKFVSLKLILFLPEEPSVYFDRWQWQVGSQNGLQTKSLWKLLERRKSCEI